jgi:hypothetical protein
MGGERFFGFIFPTKEALSGPSAKKIKTLNL